MLVSEVETVENVKICRGEILSTIPAKDVDATPKVQKVCSVNGALESASVNPTLSVTSVTCVNQELQVSREDFFLRMIYF